MSWKEISKSSYTIDVNKFTLPTSLPFSIEYEANKIYYSEGDEISSANNFIFNTDFTAIPIDSKHAPCGYWHKNYVPYVYEVYTSKLYPTYVEDILYVSAGLVGGSLNQVYDSYIIPDEVLNLVGTITGGSFRPVYKTYTIPSEGLDLESTITGGSLNQIYYTYEMLDEIVDIIGTITGGSLNEILITYQNWPPEPLSITSSIIGGSHVSV